MKIKRINTDGIQGEVALREAAAGEFHDIIRLVRDAITALLFPHKTEAWINMQSIFTDHAVVVQDGRLFSYPYTLSDDNTVALGTAVEVVLDFKPVTERMAEALASHTPSDEQGVFLEAKDKEKGLKWRIKVVQAGLSGNRNYYPDAVLREAVSKFNGVRVFTKADDEHLKGKGKSFNNLIGKLSAATFIEGKAPDSGEVHADFEVLSSAGDVAVKLLEAYDRNMSDLFGFSIDANGRAKRQRGRSVAQSITKVSSVDLIIEPGAGGELINLIEAINPEGDADMKLQQRMIEAVEKANKGILPDGLDVDNDEDLEAAYREAIAVDASASAANAEIPGAGVTRDEMNESIRMVEARSHVRVALAESALPDEAKSKLKKQFDGMATFIEANVDDAIASEKEYLANFTESGHVNVSSGTRIEMGDRGGNINAMLDKFFDRKDKDVVSFKECYLEITGDKKFTGQLRDTDNARFRESLSDAGNLDVLLGDAMQRAMLAEYNNDSQYDVWRQICNIVPVNDFRTNHRTRLGGYGDLPTVAKSGAYGALTSPGDEEATYALAKKGGTESIALEDIRNDDVGLIQRIPIKMARASKRTLAKFVLDFIVNNPVIYDGTNFFTVGHGNLGTAALDAASLAARRLAMLQQTELGSNEQIGIGPQNLLVPFALEQTAVDLFNRATENDKTFLQNLSLNVIPIWYWTDANDWALGADPMDIPGIEIGFLDGNEEPELFVQDSPTNGSMFSNDTLTWKMRHVYGGAVTDEKAFDKSVVV